MKRRFISVSEDPVGTSWINPPHPRLAASIYEQLGGVVRNAG
jgi:hypothetical protein